MAKRIIDSDKYYRISEIARPSKNNPEGLGLLPLKYLAVRRRVLARMIKAKEDKIGSKTFYFIKGSELNRYLKS